MIDYREGFTPYMTTLNDGEENTEAYKFGYSDGYVQALMQVEQNGLPPCWSNLRRLDFWKMEEELTAPPTATATSSVRRPRLTVVRGDGAA